MRTVSTPASMIVTPSLIARAVDARKAGWYSFDTDAGDGSTLWADVSDVLGCEAGDIIEAIRETPLHLSVV